MKMHNFPSQNMTAKPATPADPSEPEDAGSEIMLPHDVAEMLKVSISYLAKARMRGDGPPYYKAGRSVRYLKANVLAWLNSRSRNSTSEPDA